MVKRVLFFLLTGLLFTSLVSAQVRYTLIPESPSAGEPVTIALDYPAKDARVFINGRQVSRSAFFQIPQDGNNPGFSAAIITIPSTTDASSAVIRLDDENGPFLEIPITLTPREFGSEVIHLTPVLTDIRTDASPQRESESNRLWAILSTTGNQIYHTGPFLPPVVSTRRTSLFGYRRVFRYSNGGSDTSVHAGVDYGVPTGTAVFACGAGRVVLAQMRIVTGNSVVIEHAPGIYSLYYHLDRIDVQEGMIICERTMIGLSGATGLATGPHLHWEIRVSTENTDPDAFLSRYIIDKDLIISRIFN